MGRALKKLGLATEMKINVDYVVSISRIFFVLTLTMTRPPQWATSMHNSCGLCIWPVKVKYHTFTKMTVI